MKILVDTNIWIYALDSKSPFHKACHKLISQTPNLYIADKNIYEIYRVMTSVPNFSKFDTDSFFRDLINEKFCKICFSSSKTPKKVFNLLKNSPKKKNHIFDIVLQAIALEHDIDVIWTKNLKDFIHDTKVDIVDPMI